MPGPVVKDCRMETINASDFKTRSLAILDQIQKTGERIVILKPGRPVAELFPPHPPRAEYPQTKMKGTITVLGGIVGPTIPAERWESLKQ